MTDSATPPRLEDIASVGTRVAWSAVLAGTLLALGVYFLLATLGAAVGLSIGEHMRPSTLQMGTVIWAFLITIAALFVGGMATSLYTVGENKVEAVVSGIITWALVFALLLILGTVGLRAGFTAMTGIANSTQAAAGNWEADARIAGVSPQLIEDWRRSQGATTGAATPDRQAELDAAKRISWFAFAGTWLSMLAAAAGGYAGAGPTFRVVVKKRSLASNGVSGQPVLPVYTRS